MDTNSHHSRAKEDRIGQPLRQDEVEGARPRNRTASQEGYGKGTEKHAFRAARRVNPRYSSIDFFYTPDTPIDARNVHGAAAYDDALSCNC